MRTLTPDFENLASGDDSAIMFRRQRMSQEGPGIIKSIAVVQTDWSAVVQRHFHFHLVKLHVQDYTGETDSVLTISHSLAPMTHGRSDSIVVTVPSCPIPPR